MGYFQVNGFEGFGVLTISQWQQSSLTARSEHEKMLLNSSALAWKVVVAFYKAPTLA